MSWSGLGKVLTGFVLSLVLLFFAGAAATRYFITKLTAPPPRPTFDNDAPTQAENSSSETEQAIATSEEPSSEPAARPTRPLEPGAYEARVTQPIGLVLREEPNQDSSQLGGVEYEQQIVVLEESSDGEWLRVRLTNDSEGWVKAGNTERVN